jgi:putative molybdopterin biosynthesis protein
VARAISRHLANVGLGVETAASSFGLDFKLLTTERYDLVIPAHKWETDAVQALKRLLETDQAKLSIANLGGYDTSQTGQVIWII